MKDRDYDSGLSPNNYPISLKFSVSNENNFFILAQTPNGRINNIFNININNTENNNCQKNCEDTKFLTQNLSQKKLYDLLIISLKESGKYSTILKIVDNEEIFDKLIKKQIPLFKYSSYVIKYLNSKYLRESNYVRHFITLVE